VSGNADVAALWAKLKGRQVVVDTDSNYLCIGTLEDADGEFLTMAEADVHDMNDSSVTREVYAMESSKLGVRANRRLTRVRLARVVCVSLLEDVLRY